MSKNRTVDITDSAYTLIATGGNPGILLCDKAITVSALATPAAGQFSTIPANTRHPHAGMEKIRAKSVSGNATVQFFGS
jgi:hypothetical protein